MLGNQVGGSGTIVLLRLLRDVLEANKSVGRRGPRDGEHSACQCANKVQGRSAVEECSARRQSPSLAGVVTAEPSCGTKKREAATDGNGAHSEHARQRASLGDRDDGRSLADRDPSWLGDARAWAVGAGL